MADDNPHSSLSSEILQELMSNGRGESTTKKVALCAELCATLFGGTSEDHTQRAHLVVRLYKQVVKIHNVVEMYKELPVAKKQLRLQQEIIRTEQAFPLGSSILQSSIEDARAMVDAYKARVKVCEDGIISAIMGNKAKIPPIVATAVAAADAAADGEEPTRDPISESNFGPRIKELLKRVGATLEADGTGLTNVQLTGTGLLPDELAELLCELAKSGSVGQVLDQHEAGMFPKWIMQNRGGVSPAMVKMVEKSALWINIAQRYHDSYAEQPGGENGTEPSQEYTDDEE